MSNMPVFSVFYTYFILFECASFARRAFLCNRKFTEFPITQKNDCILFRVIQSLNILFMKYCQDNLSTLFSLLLKSL